MKLIELESMLDQDFKWDMTDLGNEAAKTSDLFVKYIKLYSSEKLTIELLENNLSQLIQQKRDYYSGNAPAEAYKEKPFDLKLKSEAGINKYVYADKDVIAYNEKILIQKQKVEILQHCLEEIKRRGFAIKTAVDYMRFMAGG